MLNGANELRMDAYLPLVYLLVLGGFLAVVAFLVVREVRRNQRQERVLSRLQDKLARGKGAAADHYELGSVYLEKQLYEQAVNQFKKALDASEEPLPLVANALGYAYFALEQYDLAIRTYKLAIEQEPTYVVALNNLGHAYEKKNLIQPALDAYEEALKHEPQNAIANRRATSLRKRI